MSELVLFYVIAQMNSPSVYQYSKRNESCSNSAKCIDPVHFGFPLLSYSYNSLRLQIYARR